MNGKKEEGCETVALFSRCPFTSPFAENDPVQCDTSQSCYESQTYDKVNCNFQSASKDISGSQFRKQQSNVLCQLPIGLQPWYLGHVIILATRYLEMPLVHLLFPPQQVTRRPNPSRPQRFPSFSAIEDQNIVKEKAPGNVQSALCSRVCLLLGFSHSELANPSPGFCQASACSSVGSELFS